MKVKFEKFEMSFGFHSCHKFIYCNSLFFDYENYKGKTDLQYIMLKNYYHMFRVSRRVLTINIKKIQ